MERQAVGLDALFVGFLPTTRQHCLTSGYHGVKVKLKFTCKFPKVIAKGYTLATCEGGKPPFNPPLGQLEPPQKTK